MMRSVLRSNSVPALVAITALVSTFAVWRYVSGAVELQQRERFMEATRVHRNALGARLAGYAALLRAGRGYVETLGRDPTAEEFHRFVESLELTRHHLGIQGYGWARMIRPDELEAHVRSERAAGRPDYDVWPAGPREIYTAIVHLEPLDWRNRRAIGFDMFSEPVRREAMARAAENGEIAATGPVELVQETGPERQTGFLMYAPVFGSPTASGPDRAKGLRGWVYAPLRLGDFVAAVGLPAAQGTLSFAIYDGDGQSAALLYESEEHPPERPPWAATERLEVGGRTWTLRYATTARFATPWERLQPPAVLTAGLVLAALLFWMTRDEAHARRRAERAAERAAFLAECGKILAGSLEYERTLPHVAQLAASRIIAACAIHVLEADRVLLALAHQEPAVGARLEAAVRESGYLHDDTTAVATAVREHRTERRRIEAGLETLSRHPALAKALRDAGLRAAVSVPLYVRGEALGAITFLSRRRRIELEDVAVAEDLARLVVAAIDTSRLYAKAQRALQERDDFLSVASHELKTPLTSLMLQSEAIRNSARRNDMEGVLRKAVVFRRNVDRLSRLVSSLLDLTRIAAGRLEISLGEVALGPLVRDVVARFEDEAERAGCRLVVDVQEPIVGHWDALRLDEVLTNLLSNAIKYGPGRPVEVVVRREGDLAILSVRDHGIGISEADQRRIFERFERAVPRTNYGGFGLGLWISRQIVHGMGGEIRVQSTPGQGSTFTVELRGLLGAGEAVEAKPARPADGDAPPAEAGGAWEWEI